MSDTSLPTGSRPLAGYAIVFLLALALRLILVAEIRPTPFYSTPLGDGAAYHAWAARIAAGDWLGSETFYQAPLYPYFLGVVYAATGPSLLAARAAQAIIGAAGCAIVVWAGGRWFSHRVGLIAGALLAVFPEAIFFDGLIQKNVLDVPLVALLVGCLGLAQARPRPAPFLVAGLTLALLSLTRENARALYFVLFPWIFVYFRDQPWRTRAAWAMTFVIGSLLAFAPVVARNYKVGGELTLTTSQLGPNFYMGNHAEATGFYVALRPGRGDAKYERRDATELAEEALGRSLSPAEVSDYWRDRALAYLRDDPWGWIRLLAWKWLILWNAAEWPDTESLRTYQEFSWLLWLTGSLVHFGIVLPWAAVGVWWSASRWRELAVLYATTLALAASVALFYVMDRYRFCLTPIVLLFAVEGAGAIVELLRTRDRRRLAVGFAILSMTAVIVHWPVVATADSRVMTYANLSAILVEERRSDDAFPVIERILALDPKHASAHHDLGAILLERGELDEAEKHFEASARWAPDNVEGLTGLGFVALRRGDVATAAARFREALDRDPKSYEAWSGWADVAVRQRNDADAEKAFRQALTLNPGLAAAHANLASFLAMKGKLEEAVAQQRASLQLDPRQPSIANDLAWTLATAPADSLRNGAEAVRWAERACEGEGESNPSFLDTLAAAYAEVGRFPDAVATAKRAIALARRAGTEDLAKGIERRLAEYENGRPFRDAAIKPTSFAPFADGLLARYDASGQPRTNKDDPTHGGHNYD